MALSEKAFSVFLKTESDGELCRHISSPDETIFHQGCRDVTGLYLFDYLLEPKWWTVLRSLIAVLPCLVAETFFLYTYIFAHIFPYTPMWVIPESPLGCLREGPLLLFKQFTPCFPTPLLFSPWSSNQWVTDLSGSERHISAHQRPHCQCPLVSCKRNHFHFLSREPRHKHNWFLPWQHQCKAS